MANPEARLQIVVVAALKAALPADAVLWATLNERNVTPQTGDFLNRMGRLPGLPDLMVGYQGRLICIELKLPRDDVRGLSKTYQSKAQKDAQAALERAGFVYRVCRTLDEVLDLLRDCQVPCRIKGAA